VRAGRSFQVLEGKKDIYLCHGGQGPARRPGLVKDWKGRKRKKNSVAGRIRGVPALDGRELFPSETGHVSSKEQGKGGEAVKGCKNLLCEGEENSNRGCNHQPPNRGFEIEGLHFLVVVIGGGAFPVVT